MSVLTKENSRRSNEREVEIIFWETNRLARATLCTDIPALCPQTSINPQKVKNRFP